MISVPISLFALAGCGSARPTIPDHIGTSTTIVLPESDPPVITKALADRIRPGMNQEEVLALLRDAGRPKEQAKSLVEVAEFQGKLNSIRYDLSVWQGKTRKLSLSFKAEKLVEKKQEGLD
jgi:hypothetical protein